MTAVGDELEQLVRDVPHATGVEASFNRGFRPVWSVAVRRDRPVHLTVGRGGTFEEALADVRRAFALPEQLGSTNDKEVRN